MPPSPPPSWTTDELLAHATFVRSVVRALVRDPEVAADVEQDTLLAAIERPPSLRKGLRAWLRGVINRRVRLHYRTQGRRDQHESDFRADNARRNGGDDLVLQTSSRSEQSSQVVRAVLSLREPYRTAIVLRYFETMPPREIASALDMPLASVYTHLQRGLGCLRERLDEDHGGDRQAWMAALTASWLGDPTDSSRTLPLSSQALAGTLALAVGAAVIWHLIPSGLHSEPISSASHAAQAGPEPHPGGKLAGGPATGMTGQGIAGSRSPLEAGSREGSPASPTPPPSDRVRVTDLQTGAPIQGALVLLRPEGQSTPGSSGLDTGGTRVTDADGEAPLPAAAEVDWLADVSAQGYLPRQDHPIAGTGPQVIALERAASVRLVRGSHQDGKTLHVILIASRGEAWDVKVVLEPERVHLDVEGLIPDRYQILARAFAETTDEERPLATGFARAPDGADAVTQREVVLRAGQTEEVTLFGDDGTDGIIRVVGGPPKNVDVLLRAESFVAVTSALGAPTAAGYRFVSIEPATYVVEVLHRDIPIALRRIDVGPEPFDIEIELGRGFLEVELVDALDPAPVHRLVARSPEARAMERRGSTVRYESPPPGLCDLWITDGDRVFHREVRIEEGPMRLRIDPSEEPLVRLSLSSSLDPRARSGGIFSRSGLNVVPLCDRGGLVPAAVSLPPGSYGIAARDEDRMRDVRFVDLTRDTTLAPAGKPLQPFELQLVRGGTPLSHTFAVLVPVGSAATDDWMSQGALTDVDGVLRLELRPGEYQVRVIDGVVRRVTLEPAAGAVTVDVGR